MTVVINKVSAADAIALKIELDQMGLVVNQDYTWEFHPVKYSNDFSMDQIADSYVSFEFLDPSMSSFFKLKWTK